PNDPGTTGATVTGTTFNATGGGTAIVRATIENGSAMGVPYTQDFNITVSLPFIPVTNITGVPTTATAGTPLTLTGTVVPSNATYQTIVWSLVNAGTTGATVTGTTFNATAAGTAIVRATIENGTAMGTPYTQDFSITVSPPTLIGTVAIEGDPMFGETLTANTDALTSNPVIPNLGALSYQWKRGGEVISGATNATYLLVQADIGNTMTVTVTAANCEGSITASPTDPVRKAPQAAPDAPTLSSQTTTSITLNTYPGCEYRMDGGNWQASTTFSGLTPNTSYSFEAYKPETATHLASPASPAATFTTDDDVIIVPFFQIVIMRWNNTLTVINNPANNGGFTFVSYQWYRNGQMEGTDQSWSAGSQGELINPEDIFYVEAVTNDGRRVRTTESTIPLLITEIKAFPNPVSIGQTLNIEISGYELSQTSVIEIYSMTGAFVGKIQTSPNQTSSNNNTSINKISIDSKYAPGVYIFRIRDEKGFRHEEKVIVNQ
ncbi:MAG: T9SS type A sorting domain-containing protein, partial [Peptococcaceae bacterium]|nr:T9SS type A sorting domain-containing protein [Peptococcaceae bacterium]